MSETHRESAAVRVRGLERRFGAVAVLRRLDLDVSRGECVAVFGPNGAGKSTLLRTLAGLVRPDAGSVENLGRQALGRLTGPGLLVLSHQGADRGGRKPFSGARIFPWRATRHAVRLDARSPVTAVIGDELWTAVAVEADPADGPFVLELVRVGQAARQAVLVARGSIRRTPQCR